MENIVEQVILCECSGAEHQMLIMYDKDDTDPTVYVSVHLTKKNFWDRVSYAFKYIFGYQSRFGAFDEILLGPKHISPLQAVVDHIKKVEANKLQLNLFDGRTDIDVPESELPS